MIQLLPYRKDLIEYRLTIIICFSLARKNIKGQHCGRFLSSLNFLSLYLLRKIGNLFLFFTQTEKCNTHAIWKISISTSRAFWWEFIICSSTHNFTNLNAQQYRIYCHMQCRRNMSTSHSLDIAFHSMNAQLSLLIPFIVLRCMCHFEDNILSNNKLPIMYRMLWSKALGSDCVGLFCKVLNWDGPRNAHSRINVVFYKRIGKFLKLSYLHCLKMKIFYIIQSNVAHRWILQSI